MTAERTVADATVPAVTRRIEVTVNGRPRSFDVLAHHTLLESLRDDLGLTGTKECCLVGECGACTVMVDGRTVDSCLMLAVEADGATVATVEGLAVGGHLTPLQRAFLDTGAAQCGFCIPGQLMSATALLAITPHPDRAEIEEGLAGNLCRCAGYEQIMEAVARAADGGARQAHRFSADGHGASTADQALDGEMVARPDPASTPDADVAPQ